MFHILGMNSFDPPYKNWLYQCQLIFTSVSAQTLVTNGVMCGSKDEVHTMFPPQPHNIMRPERWHHLSCVVVLNKVYVVCHNNSKMCTFLRVDTTSLISEYIVHLPL